MLHFNTPEGGKERQETEPLTMDEENTVVGLLIRMGFAFDKYRKYLGFSEGISKDQIALLQKFLNNYQNMKHYVDTTQGLWCKDAPVDGGFQLKFKP